MPHDRAHAGAAGAGGRDVLEALHLHGGGLRHAHDARHEDDRERDQRVGQPGAERARDGDGEQHGRERVEDVHRAHDERVRQAADVAGEHAEAGAQHEPDHDRRERGDEGHAAAPQQAAQHVPPLLVRAQEMGRRADGRQPQPDRAGVRVVGREPRRQHGREHDEDEDGAGDQRGRIACEPPRDRLPVGHRRRDAGGEFLRQRGGDGHQCRAIRGSTTVCSRSTARLSSTKNVARTRITPWSTGRSRWKIARFSR